MRLRIRDAPAGVSYSHYPAIEKDAYLVGSKVSHVALERVKV
jgi:hypothetical protein